MRGLEDCARALADAAAADEGWAHSGLAYQPEGNPTPLSTVEGCILEALEEARLIEPITQLEGFGCGFERCGRTDAGVSSSAQVINLWVRSGLLDPMGTGLPAGTDDEAGEPGKARVELPYVVLLNRFLPPSIRILAWSPVTAEFSSRFSCIWRHYKYFFSTSPSAPVLRPHLDCGAAYPDYRPVNDAGEQEPEPWRKNLADVDWRGLELDVEAMQDAASRLVGEHDFRNMCKVDPPKQLPAHMRTVNSATIDRVEGEGPDMYVLNLRGGAFLYNQVRHIVALLFLVGARLETPDLVEKMMWTSDTHHTRYGRAPTEEESTWDFVDGKPSYGMADDLSLILWQCGYNSSEFDWRVDNGQRAYDVSAAIATLSCDAISAPTSTHGAHRQALDPMKTFTRQFLEMNRVYTESRLKSIILKHHLAAFCALAPPTIESDGPDERVPFYTPHGSGTFTATGKYIPMLSRPRADLPEVMNKNWALGRGLARMTLRAENQGESDRQRVVNLAKKESARLQAKQELEDAVASRAATPTRGAEDSS